MVFLRRNIPAGQKKFRRGRWGPQEGRKEPEFAPPPASSRAVSTAQGDAAEWLVLGTCPPQAAGEKDQFMDLHGTGKKICLPRDRLGKLGDPLRAAPHPTNRKVGAKPTMFAAKTQIQE